MGDGARNGLNGFARRLQGLLGAPQPLPDKPNPARALRDPFDPPPLTSLVGWHSAFNGPGLTGRKEHGSGVSSSSRSLRTCLRVGVELGSVESEREEVQREEVEV